MGGGNYTSVPTILLKWKWLEEAGFNMGEYVAVEIDGDRIILSKTTPSEKPKRLSIEEKINELDLKQLKKLNTYLDGLKKWWKVIVMLKYTGNGTTLRENLINDGFFDDSDILNIVDDYNIVDIEDDAIDFYFKTFNDINLRTINIYFQVKEISEQRKIEIEDLARYYEMDGVLLLALCVFLMKGLYPPHTPVRDLLLKQSNYHKLVKAIRFVERLRDIGIDVVIHPYSSLNFKPPFHGRYWFTEDRGYIVDASLNTYGRGLIFAQRMDDVNFHIIKDELIERYVIPNSRSYIPLNYENLLFLMDRIFGR